MFKKDYGAHRWGCSIGGQINKWFYISPTSPGLLCGNPGNGFVAKAYAMTDMRGKMQ